MIQRPKVLNPRPTKAAKEVAGVAWSPTQSLAGSRFVYVVCSQVGPSAARLRDGHPFVAKVRARWVQSSIFYRATAPLNSTINAPKHAIFNRLSMRPYLSGQDAVTELRCLVA